MQQALVIPHSVRSYSTLCSTREPKRCVPGLDGSQWDNVHLVSVPTLACTKILRKECHPVRRLSYASCESIHMAAATTPSRCVHKFELTPLLTDTPDVPIAPSSAHAHMQTHMPIRKHKGANVRRITPYSAAWGALFRSRPCRAQAHHPPCEEYSHLHYVWANLRI